MNRAGQRRMGAPEGGLCTETGTGFGPSVSEIGKCSFKLIRKLLIKITLMKAIIIIFFVTNITIDYSLKE